MVISRRSGLMIAVVSVCALSLTNVAQADPVLGTSADFLGTRTVLAGELITDPSPSGWSGASISWVIVDNGDGTLTYTYTLAGFTPSRGGGISHFSMSISSGADEDANSVTNALFGTSLDNLVPVDDVEFDDPLAGFTPNVKFDTGIDDLDVESSTLIYQFVSNRLPIWGHVYVKAGLIDLWNVGINNTSSSNTSYFIATPDTTGPDPGPVIPLPGAVWMGLALLGGLATRRGRRVPA